MLSYLFMCNVDYIQLSKTLLLLQTNWNALVVRFLMKDLRKGVACRFRKGIFKFPNSMQDKKSLHWNSI